MMSRLFIYYTAEDSGVGFEADGMQLSLNAALKVVKQEAGDEIPDELGIYEAAIMVNQKPDIFNQLIKYIRETGKEKECALPQGWEFGIPVQPTKIIAIGRNYTDHAKEMNNEPPKEPMFFSKLTSSMTSNKRPVAIPEGVGRVDHEIELAVIIGSTATRVSQDKAMDHVLGYTIFNDITARDMQKEEGAKGKPWTRAKGFDTFGPCGPYLVPKVMIEDPHNLELELRVNGEVRQTGNTGDMVFKIPELIEFVSDSCTLFPGDVIITGTPAGVSPLKAGDVITAGIDNLGLLESPVTSR